MILLKKRLRASVRVEVEIEFEVESDRTCELLSFTETEADELTAWVMIIIVVVRAETGILTSEDPRDASIIVHSCKFDNRVKAHDCFTSHDTRSIPFKGADSLNSSFSSRDILKLIDDIEE